MHELNGALFLKVLFLFILLSLLVPLTVILSFIATYISQYSHKYDFKIDGLNVIYLFAGHWLLNNSPFQYIDSLSTSICRKL